MRNVLRYFFGKEHLTRTIWGVVLIFAGYFINTLLSAGKQPARVFVTNAPALRDTVVLSMETGRGNTANELQATVRELAGEVKALRHSMSLVPARSNSTLSRMRPQPLTSTSPANPQPIKLTFIPEVTQAPFKIPKYQLPKVVQGYTQGKLSSFAKMSLPETDFKEGQEISFTLELLDPTMLTKITPLFVSVLRKESENNYTLLYDQQFVLQKGKNLVTLLADFGTGRFVLTVGFYLSSGVDQKYPTFYQSQSGIVVKG